MIKQWEYFIKKICIYVFLVFLCISNDLKVSLDFFKTQNCEWVLSNNVT